MLYMLYFERKHMRVTRTVDVDKGVMKIFPYHERVDKENKSKVD